MRILKLTPGPHVDELFQEVLSPAFPPAELCSLADLRDMIAEGQPGLIALDDDGRVIGGLIGEWDPDLRVLLISWLAVRSGIRSGGTGSGLLDTALASWPDEYGACLILAEVEDPALHQASEATGDPVARLRFYQRRGARALDLPYFQASLGPGLSRVNGLMLMVLHTEPQFAGAAPETIGTGLLRTYLERYQIACEGSIGTDEQAMALWQTLDAQPDGVSLLPLGTTPTSGSTTIGTPAAGLISPAAG